MRALPKLKPGCPPARLSAPAPTATRKLRRPNVVGA